MIDNYRMIETYKKYREIDDVRKFLNESWMIERLPPEDVTANIINRTNNFLKRKTIAINHVLDLAQTYAFNGIIRSEKGMDVIVGNHIPLKGGPKVTRELIALISDIDCNVIDPWEGHIEFENLHPFMDGNGRTGRTVWAWHMINDEKNPFALSFLHQFYYQTLAHKEQNHEST